MGMLRILRRGLTWSALALAGGAAVVTVRHLLESPQPLHSALPGVGRIDREHGGEMYYNVAGPEAAPPIVLLHDFSPGASNYEYREVFSLLASTNRVYAPDWLGFGMSEHPNIAYTGEFYAGVLTGFLRDVVAAPAIVVGLGRAANVVVRAASDSPRLFSSVVLVSPDITAGAHAEPTVAQTAVRGAQRAFLGIVPYAVVSTRPVLRYLASRDSGRRGAGATAADDAVDQRYSSAHQFGGQYAALAMLTGELDLPVRNAFALLEPPALVVIGAADDHRPVTEVAKWTSVNPRADLEQIPGAGYAVPSDEPRAFVAAVDRWLDTLPPALGGVAAVEGQETAARGLPGDVVPGVSDMGPEGPAAVTVNGISTMEPPIELGPAPAPTEAQLQAEMEAQGLAGTPAAELPEAGDANPASRDEQMARQGTYPPREPADNIATVAPVEDLAATAQPTAQPTETAAEIVQQSETPPPLPEPRDRSARTTRPISAETAEGADLGGEEAGPAATQHWTQPGSAQSSHRMAARQPSAHLQASGAAQPAKRGASKSGSRSGSTRSGSGGKSAKGTQRSKGTRGTNNGGNASGN
jgi:pimeloyl-ACP methyl ester carboxylesterase